MHALERDPINLARSPLARGAQRAPAARTWLLGACALLLLVAASVALRAEAAEGAALRFDATSADSFEASYAAIIATLPESRVPVLELAVERTLRYYALTSGRSLEPADLLTLFGGKTAAEVVAAAPPADDPILS